MASSKNLFLFLALLFALALLVSSQVAASEEGVKANGVEEVKYGGHGYGHGGHYGGPGYGHGGHYGGRGGGGCRYGCCYRYGSGCKRCCGSADESPDAEFEHDVKN